jgi:hypothetical protein
VLSTGQTSHLYIRALSQGKLWRLAPDHVILVINLTIA